MPQLWSAMQLVLDQITSTDACNCFQQYSYML